MHVRRKGVWLTNAVKLIPKATKGHSLHETKEGKKKKEDRVGIKLSVSIPEEEKRGGAT